MAKKKRGGKESEREKRHAKKKKEEQERMKELERKMAEDRLNRYNMFKDRTDDKEFAEYFIKELLKCPGATKFKSLDCFRIIHICKKIVESQPRLVEINPPVRVVADIHGQYSDLIRMFDMCGFPPESNYMFLGDYVDRGHWSIETMYLLLAFKARYPNTFFLLRGNHEAAYMNVNEGFHTEYIDRRPETVTEEVDAISDLFEVMPLCGLIGGRILCMHGGISPHLNSLDDLRKMEPSFTDYERDCLETDLMWADPSYKPGWTLNPRGASYCFGEDVCKQMCEKLGIDLIIRGHQVQQNGYEFFADKHLVTIFSAPHYTGTFSNYAAVAVISEGLEVSFEVLKPIMIPVEYVDDNDTLTCEPYSKPKTA